MDFTDATIIQGGDVNWQPVLAIAFMEVADNIRARGYEVLVGGSSPDGQRRMMGLRRKAAKS